MPKLLNIAMVGTSIVREGLFHILSQGPFVVTCSVNANQDLIRTLHRSHGTVDLILIENRDVGSIGPQIRQLLVQFPHSRIALISEVFDFRAMLAAVRAGVHGVIIAEISCESLIESLKLIAIGDRILPSQLADYLPVYLSSPDQSPTTPDIDEPILSPRDIEVMRCLAMGCPNKVIARRLSITEAAVKVRVKAVLRKIPVRNRTQAAIWAAKRGLIAFSDPGHSPSNAKPFLAASPLSSGWRSKPQPA